MFVRSLFFIAFLLLSGCVVKSPAEAESEPQVVVPEPIPVVVETVAPEPDVAGACEILLQRLEETGPLLTSLDESLANQAERFDEAISSINQPAAEPPVPVCPPSTNGTLGGKEIIGAIEWLYIDPPGRHFRARIDSGAETSSLSAADVIEFERDGDEWVRFYFQPDTADELVEFEVPIKRTVLVRQISSDDPERRFVVELDIRLGDQLQTTEFTLTDRSSMTYPLLLGRAFLLDLYVIDVSRSYTHDRYDAG
jgi:hypothetical protein